MTYDEIIDEFTRLKQEHTHFRDNHNNYGCYNVETCRNCNFVYNSRGCINCSGGDGLVECVQCVDCRDCAFCVGLQGARFHILNKEYSEEEYYRILEEAGVDHKVDAHP
ncbi:MAG: hypothetical protein Kow0056_01440 [Coriobacteriia bacterium]